MSKMEEHRLFLASKAEELCWCTPIKTSMMLLVVLYHSCAMWMVGGWFAEPAVPCAALGLFAEWLSTFHVPVFVAASGYLWGYLKRETDRYGDPATVLRKKAKRLLVPYAFACAVWVVPFWIHFHGTDGLIKKYVLACSPSQLWFLVMLFVLFVLSEMVWPILKRWEGGPWAVVALGVSLYFAGHALGVALSANFFQVATALQYAPIFLLGYLFRSCATSGFWRIPPSSLFAVHLGLFTLLETAGFVRGGGVAGYVLNAVLWLPMRVAGVAAMVSLSGRVYRLLRYDETPAPRWWTFLERGSFAIYLFHQQLIQIILSSFNVASFPPPALALLCFAPSLLISCAIYAVLRRLKVTRYMIGG